MFTKLRLARVNARVNDARLSHRCDSTFSSPKLSRLRVLQASLSMELMLLGPYFAHELI